MIGIKRIQQLIKVNAFQENQEKAKKANGYLAFEEKAKKAKKADKDKEKDKEKDKDKDKEKDKECEEPCGSTPAPEKPVFHKFGEYKHVRLTDEQHSKLISEYGEKTITDYIRRVDEYCQQYGKNYKDYNLTIRNWIRKDNVTNDGEYHEDNNGRNEASKYSTVF